MTDHPVPGAPSTAASTTGSTAGSTAASTARVDPGAPGPRGVVPGYPVLLGIVAGVCVGGMALSTLAEILGGYIGEGPQPRSLGQQLAGILGFGTLGIALSVGAVRWAGEDLRRRRTGAVLLGALTVPALAFFWCGMPGLLGAAAARLAGLTRGTAPLTGAPRVLGVVGLVMAVLNPVTTAVLAGGSWLVELL